jgi:hypothetical protein
MNALEYLKIVGSHVVLTAFRDRHNQLIDRVIYDVKVETEADGSKNLVFFLNKSEFRVPIPTTLSSLTDVNLSSLVDGQTIIYNAKTLKWINSTPSLSSLSDVSLKIGDNFSSNEKLKDGDVLLYKGGSWTNGISENTQYGTPTFINNGDSYTTALGSLDEILGLLAPAKPQNLSTKVLSIDNSYTAIETKSNTSKTNITRNRKPVLRITGGAYNAASGSLSAKLWIGSNMVSKDTTAITFTKGNDTGKTASDAENNLTLSITTDYDFHAGQSGKSGFWMAFDTQAAINVDLPTTNDVHEHKLSITHSQTGTTQLTFYTDDSTTPTISNDSLNVIIKHLVNSIPTIKRISGVPTLTVNDELDVTFQVNNAINNFYNSTIARATSSVTNTHDFVTNTPKQHGDYYVANTKLLVSNGVFNSNVSVDYFGFSAGYSINDVHVKKSVSIANKAIRVDTKSDELNGVYKRVTSGMGLAPLTGYGSSYDSNMSLYQTVENNYKYEMQLSDAKYQYPKGNYSNLYPTGGANYDLITSGWRYVTFSTLVDEVTSIKLYFDLIEDFSKYANADKTLDTNFFTLQVKVDSTEGKGTNGWIDANKAHSPSVPNPTNTGDGALALGSTTTVVNSTTFSRDVTFGTVNKKGTCYVRVGFNHGATMKFNRIRIV